MGATEALGYTLYYTTYYIIYPFILTYHASLIIFAPVLHIIEHIGRATLLPLSFLAKFEVSDPCLHSLLPSMSI